MTPSNREPNASRLSRTLLARLSASFRPSPASFRRSKGTWLGSSWTNRHNVAIDHLMLRHPKAVPSSFLAAWAAGVYKDEAHLEPLQIIPVGSLRDAHRAARLEAVTKGPPKPLAQFSPQGTGAVPLGSPLTASGSRGGESGSTCGSMKEALPPFFQSCYPVGYQNKSFKDRSGVRRLGVRHPTSAG